MHYFPSTQLTGRRSTTAFHPLSLARRRPRTKLSAATITATILAALGGAITKGKAMKVRRVSIFALIALAVPASFAGGIVAQAQFNTKNYTEQGGARTVIAAKSTLSLAAS